MKVSERAIVFVVAAVQFINILDFMMVMPLGPDFAATLHIPASELGTVGGSYALAAAVAGLVGSLFLDRFDRRKALAVAVLGLVVGTAAGGLAVNLETLIAARVVAGMFGGPATSIALAIISDVIPPERRGRAMSRVMIAFSVASVLGVPAGLELSRLGGWRLPFFAVAALGLVFNVVAFKLLPPLRIHLDLQRDRPPVSRAGLFRRPIVLISYAMTAVVMMGGFILIPNISAYVQYNVGYPRDKLGLLYLVGGLASFVTLPLIGRLVDRLGAFKVGTVGALMNVAVVYVGFVAFPPPVGMIAVFVGFMLANNTRNLAYSTLTTKVPGPAERAQFMSIQSAVQHMASAAGAFLSSRLLGENADQSLVGMSSVAWVSIGMTLAVPLFLWRVERDVGRAHAAGVDLAAVAAKDGPNAS